jgi:hypothetical protein
MPSNLVAATSWWRCHGEGEHFPPSLDSKAVCRSVSLPALTAQLMQRRMVRQQSACVNFEERPAHTQTARGRMVWCFS